MSVPAWAQVLVAVGGASYGNWRALNAGAIAAFVAALGLDGVVINYTVRTFWFLLCWPAASFVTL